MYNNLQIGVTENLTSSGDFEMSSQRVKIVEGGKLVIPAAFRRELGINPGDTVVVPYCYELSRDSSGLMG